MKNIFKKFLCAAMVAALVAPVLSDAGAMWRKEDVANSVKRSASMSTAVIDCYVYDPVALKVYEINEECPRFSYDNFELQVPGSSKPLTHQVKVIEVLGAKWDAKTLGLVYKIRIGWGHSEENSEFSDAIRNCLKGSVMLRTLHKRYGKDVIWGKVQELDF